MAPQAAMVGSLLLLPLLLLAVLGCPAAANPNGLGMTPPMGWRADPTPSPLPLSSVSTRTPLTPTRALLRAGGAGTS